MIGGFIWDDSQQHWVVAWPWWFELPRLIVILGLLPLWVSLALLFLAGFLVGRTVRYVRENRG